MGSHSAGDGVNFLHSFPKNISGALIEIPGRVVFFPGLEDHLLVRLRHPGQRQGGGLGDGSSAADQRLLPVRRLVQLRGNC